MNAPRTNTFKITAQSSLKIKEVEEKPTNLLMNTFKGGSDLRAQLAKRKGHEAPSKLSHGKATQLLTGTLFKKSEDEALLQEVAALDEFKTPVTSDKTRGMIENIKLRRRKQHIEAEKNFHEDMEEYKDNLRNIYDSVTDEAKQFLSLRKGIAEDSIRNMSGDQTLLSKEAELLIEVHSVYNDYSQAVGAKLTFLENELRRLKSSRNSLVNDTCSIFRDKLIEIAFILEPEARQIEDNQLNATRALEESTFNHHYELYKQMHEQQQAVGKAVKELAEATCQKWRNIKQSHQIELYRKNMESENYRFPSNMRELYQNLSLLQHDNCEKKKKILNSMVLQSPDTFNKQNIDRLNELSKNLNDSFDAKLDGIFSGLMDAHSKLKAVNQSRMDHLVTRLKYIGSHSQEQLEKLVQEQFKPILERNNNEAQTMLKDATNYVQNCEERQNKMVQRFVTILTSLASRNDDFTKDFSTLNQSYELEKAKILDQDEETVQKLNLQLEALKKELSEALHHMKLEERQEKCFAKIDQLESVYRATHTKNKELIATRPAQLDKFFTLYEAKIAEVFQLYDPSKKQELVERWNKRADEDAQKQVELEEKLKLEEENRQIEDAKKKGGKPPAPAKPKDPKKQAAELEQRKKAILAANGPPKIEELRSETGTVWLVYKSAEEICRNLYVLDEQPPTNTEEAKNEERLMPTVNFVGEKIVADKAQIDLSQTIKYFVKLRDSFFKAVGEKKNRIVEISTQNDEQCLSDSLVFLDGRLKEHYSLKGKLESELFIRRSSEIANHKKKYEKYVRDTRDEMDLQTEKFNHLLENSLQLLKEHISAQKTVREQLINAKTLSELQSLQAKARHNFNSFSGQLHEIGMELDNLSTGRIDLLINSNKNFITKECKSLKDGGEYSAEEQQWYQKMLDEVTVLIEQQKTKRNQKKVEVKESTTKKMKELLQTFEKQYQAAIKDLEAREATGKKFGKPKRIAQQKTRLEMNKCEQAQLNIDQQIKAIEAVCDEAASRNFQIDPIPTLILRNKLMTLYTCIGKYARHIEALVPGVKVPAMARVNYKEDSIDCVLIEQDQEDKKRQATQVEAVGVLGLQKEEKPFRKFIEQIEKLMLDEAKLLYVGDAVKFTNGTDKIPTALRNYITNMKNNAEAFRVVSCRQLRDSCDRLAQLSKKIGDAVLLSTNKKHVNILNEASTSALASIKSMAAARDETRKIHLKKLRPNLSNPKCQQQLKLLDEAERSHSKNFESELTKVLNETETAHFSNGTTLLAACLNNYQFLLLYTDSMLLQEDFNSLPGDQQNQKKHLDMRRLLLMKQKNINYDSESSRNIKKKWPGVQLSLFDFGSFKFEVKKPVEEAKEKDKKAAKKDTKDPKKVEEPPASSDGKIKEIQTIKTWRQKAIFECRTHCLDEYVNAYSSLRAHISNLVKQVMSDNQEFTEKWAKITKELYL